MSKLNQDLADVVENFFRGGTNDPNCREIAESLWKVQIQDVMVDAIQDQLGNVKKILEKRDTSWHVMLVTKYYYDNYRGVFKEGYDGMALEEESEIKRCFPLGGSGYRTFGIRRVCNANTDELWLESIGRRVKMAKGGLIKNFQEIKDGYDDGILDREKMSELVHEGTTEIKTLFKKTPQLDDVGCEN